MAAQEDLNRLATRWWRIREPGGFFFPTMDLPPEEQDAAVAIDDAVYALVRDPATLRPMFEAIIAACPDETELAYVGASVVEEAERFIGPGALLILEESSVHSEKLAKVMAGYWPPMPPGMHA